MTVSQSAPAPSSARDAAIAKEIGAVIADLVGAAVKYQAGVKRAAIKDMRAGIERMRALLRMLGDDDGSVNLVIDPKTRLPMFKLHVTPTPDPSPRKRGGGEKRRAARAQSSQRSKGHGAR